MTPAERYAQARLVRAIAALCALLLLAALWTYGWQAAMVGGFLVAFTVTSLVADRAATDYEEKRR